jgi:hypothetical protein
MAQAASCVYARMSLEMDGTLDFDYYSLGESIWYLIYLELLQRQPNQPSFEKLQENIFLGISNLIA